MPCSSVRCKNAHFSFRSSEVGAPFRPQLSQKAFCQIFEAHRRVENFTEVRMQKSASRFVDGEASYERSKFAHSSVSKAVPLSLLLCTFSIIISAIYATKMQIWLRNTMNAHGKKMLRHRGRRVQLLCCRLREESVSNRWRVPNVVCLVSRLRPHLVENTASRPIC